MGSFQTVRHRKGRISGSKGVEGETRKGKQIYTKAGETRVFEAGRLRGVSRRGGTSRRNLCFSASFRDPRMERLSMVL
jgi:hypothetical protein